MFSFFSIDSPFYRTLTKISNYLILGVVWVIACIPIVTIGAACTALYSAHHKVIKNGNGYAWRTFWEQFRANFKQSTVLGLLMLVIAVVFAADFYIMFILNSSGQMNALSIVFSVLAVLGVMWMQYWFPYISHIDDPIKTVLKNTLIITFAHLPQSIMITVVFGVCVALNVFLPVNPICLIAAPIIYSLFSYKSFYRVFSNYWDMTDGNADFEEMQQEKE